MFAENGKAHREGNFDTRLLNLLHTPFDLVVAFLEMNPKETITNMLKAPLQ